MNAPPRRPIVVFLLASSLVVVALAVGVSPLASAAPDGLERVALDHGFADRADPPLAAGPLADYAVRGVDTPWLAVGLAGLLGVVGTFAVSAAALWLVRRGTRSGS